MIISSCIDILNIFYPIYVSIFFAVLFDWCHCKIRGDGLGKMELKKWPDVDKSDQILFNKIQS